jgi:hypothetical protein
MESFEKSLKIAEATATVAHVADMLQEIVKASNEFETFKLDGYTHHRIEKYVEYLKQTASELRQIY